MNEIRKSKQCQNEQIGRAHIPTALAERFRSRYKRELGNALFSSVLRAAWHPPLLAAPSARAMLSLARLNIYCLSFIIFVVFIFKLKPNIVGKSWNRLLEVVILGVELGDFYAKL
jgi:hypothetical protein